MNKNRLIIFTRNPELGKVKSRLAKTVGDQAALEIYNFLLNHTREITEGLDIEKVVYYSEYIPETDDWSNDSYKKALQIGDDLGVCMFNAFKDAFNDGLEKVVIIGSDIHDLNSSDIEAAFESLDSNDYVIGPAHDGGYYLLGMTALNKEIFTGINWGSNEVLSSTLQKLKDSSVKLLDIRNDIDYFEDIKNEAVFQPFIKHLNVEHRK